MPRIQTLKQNVRMQVQNPTPIQSPEAARSAGEGLAELGKALGGFTEAVGEVYLKADQEERKFAAEKSKIMSKGFYGAALADTEKSQDIMGRDKEAIFLESFDKQASEYLKNERREDVRKAAELNFLEDRMRGQLELKKQAPADAALGADLLRKENFRARNGQALNSILYSNPREYQAFKRDKGYLKIMADNEAELSASDIYSPMQKQTFLLNERAALARTTIRAFKEKGDFVAAEEALKDLSGILGEDESIAIRNEIKDTKYENKSRDITLSNAAMSAAERAEKFKDEARYGTALSDLLSTPAAQRPAKLQMWRMKGLPDSDAVKLEKTVGVGAAEKGIARTSIKTVIDHYTRAYRGENVKAEVIRAQERGLYGPDVGADIFRAQSISRGIQNSKKGVDQPKFQKSGETLNKKGKEVLDVNSLREANQEHINNVMLDEDPDESAAKVLAKYGKKEQRKRRAEATDPFVLEIFDQRDVKSLSAMLPVLKQKKAGMSTKDWVTVMKAYKAQMQLLNLTQGGEDERRR